MTGIRPALIRRARVFRARADDLELRRARRLRHALRVSPPDVIEFGDSCVQFTTEDDTDPRPLYSMVADAVADRHSLYPLVDGGYHARLFDAYLQLVAQTDVRPAVIVPLCIRLVYPAWELHPVYSFERSERVIRAAAASRWRPLYSTKPTVTSEAMARHDRTPHESPWGKVVGDYRSILRAPRGTYPDESRLELIYAYHHGSLVAADNPFLAGLTALGATCRRLGLPVVTYETPVPIETAERVLGPGIRSTVEANFARLRTAFRSGYGNVDVLRTGTMFSESDFIDPTDACEHIRDGARRQLADLIVGRLDHVLASPALPPLVDAGELA